MGVSAALAGFLQEPLLAVVGTRRRDGSVALTPVWFEYREYVGEPYAGPYEDRLIIRLRASRIRSRR